MHSEDLSVPFLTADPKTTQVYSLGIPIMFVSGSPRSLVLCVNEGLERIVYLSIVQPLPNRPTLG